MTKPIGFIYMTINKINNKKYIGQHTNFEDNYLGSGTILLRAIKKYGRDSFERVMLDIAYSQQELNEKEKYYIKEYNAIINREFYNIHIGGSGGDTFTGRSESEKEEYRIKMSRITRGKNNGMYGKRHTSNSRNKMKLTKLLNESHYIYKTEAFRSKMRDVTKGENNGMYGKKHSEESKSLMSKNRMGKTLGEKNGMYGMKDEKALNSKKVYQYADQEMMHLIQTFNSVQCTLKHLNLKGHSGLYKAFKSKTKYKGFYWSKEKKGVETNESTN